MLKILKISFGAILIFFDRVKEIQKILKKRDGIREKNLRIKPV